ncbi:MAG: peptidoglycan DD-metalloendopeptidase family protein [Clostridia bacterium]|nr:peptidoglycan DD-metalloendopeptidase family protein [Clostridia bacterium]
MKKNSEEKNSSFFSSAAEALSNRKSAIAVALFLLTAAALVMVTAGFCAVSDRQAQDLNNANSEKYSVEKELDETEEKLKKAYTELAEALEKLENYDEVMSGTNEELRSLKEESEKAKQLIDEQLQTIASQKSVIEDQRQTIDYQQETIDKTDELISEINEIIGTNIEPLSGDSMYEGISDIEETQEVIVKAFNNSAKAKEYVALLDETKAEINESLKYYPDHNPAVGRISYTFGDHSVMKNGKTVYKFHKGLDIFNHDGGAIYAAAAGTVTEVHSKDDCALGIYVRINHGNGYMTVYGHLSSASVKVGQKVEKGQQIAKMGKTGAATGIHLHFEVYLHGELKDPLDYVDYQ